MANSRWDRLGCDAKDALAIVENACKGGGPVWHVDLFMAERIAGDPEALYAGIRHLRDAKVIDYVIQVVDGDAIAIVSAWALRRQLDARVSEIIGDARRHASAIRHGRRVA